MNPLSDDTLSVVASFLHTHWQNSMYSLFRNGSRSLTGKMVFSRGYTKKYIRIMETPFEDLPGMDKEKFLLEATNTLKVFTKLQKVEKQRKETHEPMENVKGLFDHILSLLFRIPLDKWHIGEDYLTLNVKLNDKVKVTYDVNAGLDVDMVHFPLTEEQDAKFKTIISTMQLSELKNIKEAAEAFLDKEETNRYKVLVTPIPEDGRNLTHDEAACLKRIRHIPISTNWLVTRVGDSSYLGVIKKEEIYIILEMKGAL